MANVLDWDNVVSSNSSRAIIFPFRIIPLEMYEPSNPPAMDQIVLLLSFFKDEFSMKLPLYGWYVIKQRKSTNNIIMFYNILIVMAWSVCCELLLLYSA